MNKIKTNKICFAQDTAKRKQWFKAASFSHPAKMVLGLQIYLIERYTKVGDTILDPMAGSGTLLAACTLGRSVVMVELEGKFIKMQQANWDKIKSHGAMLGYTMGQATILQGDARNLQGLLADKIVFSPPYAGINADIGKTNKKLVKDLAQKFKMPSWIDSSRSPFRDKSVPDNPSNIGNLPYGDIDKIVFSPPYAGTREAINKADKDKWQSQLQGNGTKHHGQTGGFKASGISLPENSSNIANLPYGSIDAVISSPPTDKADVILTSPPYAETANASKNTGSNLSEVERKSLAGKRVGLTEEGMRYFKDTNNIGNLKAENYLAEMLKVYRECFAVLKDKGLLVLVTKNFIRNKKIVDLAADTIRLCEQAGFKFKERLARKLMQQSFWRVIYMKKYPDAPKIEYEDILVFEKI